MAAIPARIGRLSADSDAGLAPALGLAGGADAHPVGRPVFSRPFVVVSVLGRERVAALAVGLMDLPASHVLVARDGLQVSRIDAVLHAAQVVELHPVGDRADTPLVSGAVHDARRPAGMHPAVPVGLQPIRPRPAGIRAVLGGELIQPLVEGETLAFHN